MCDLEAAGEGWGCISVGEKRAFAVSWGGKFDDGDVGDRILLTFLQVRLHAGSVDQAPPKLGAKGAVDEIFQV